MSKKKDSKSGRDLFTLNPELFVDEDEATEIDYETRENEDDGPIVKLEATGTSIRSTILNEKKEKR